jgi:hypothetical protein
MTYVINTKTKEIKEFNEPFHLLSANYSSGDWREATEEEALPSRLKKAKDAKIAQCKAYLLSTDWQVVRFAETQVAVDSQVLTNRGLARSNQDLITASTTLGELNNINTDF